MIHKESPPAKNSFLEDLDNLEVSGKCSAVNGTPHVQWQMLSELWHHLWLNYIKETVLIITAVFTFRPWPKQI